MQNSVYLAEYVWESLCFFTRFTNTSRFKQLITIRLNIDFLEEVLTKVMTFVQSVPYSALSEYSKEKLPCCLGRKVNGRDILG